MDTIVYLSLSFKLIKISVWDLKLGFRGKEIAFSGTESRALRNPFYIRTWHSST